MKLLKKRLCLYKLKTLYTLLKTIYNILRCNSYYNLLQSSGGYRVRAGWAAARTRLFDVHLLKISIYRVSQFIKNKAEIYRLENENSSHI